jgi:D-alanine-D-alanine ligase
MSKHVAVLMGGWSSEREVSLRSGKPCADALERSGYRVTRVDVGRDIATVLRTLKPDVALNMLHGRPGEDGTIQGVLEIVGIPYTHSGVLASSLAMNKEHAKVVMAAAGVPVPDGKVVTRAEAAAGTSAAAALCRSSRSARAPASACSSSPRSTPIRRRN